MYASRFDVWFTYVPQGKDIVNVAFPNCRLKNGSLRIVVSICAIKILAKETAVSVPIAVPWVCR